MIQVDITACLLPSLDIKPHSLAWCPLNRLQGEKLKKGRQLANVQKHLSLALLMEYDIDSKFHETSEASIIHWTVYNLYSAVMMSYALIDLMW